MRERLYNTPPIRTTAKRFRRSAQCCRETATLGTRHYRFRNPDRVASLYELVPGVAFGNAGLEAVTALRFGTRHNDRHSLLDSLRSLIEDQVGLTHAPLPNTVLNFLIKRMAGLFQRQRDLSAMVRFVRNQIAEEGYDVGLKTLYLSAGRQTPAQ